MYIDPEKITVIKYYFRVKLKSLVIYIIPFTDNLEKYVKNLNAKKENVQTHSDYFRHQPFSKTQVTTTRNGK